MRPTVLALVAVLLLPLVPLPPAAEAASYTSYAHNFYWSPSSFSIQSGDTITFRLGSGSHNYRDSLGNACSLPCTRTFTVTSPTTVNFWCGVHPSSMTGSISISVPPPPAPPSVAMTSPASGSTVSGTFAVEGTASHDTATISKVEVKVDNGAFAPATLVGSGSSVTWTTNVDTSKLLNGAHKITARATSSNGGAAETSVSVTVDNPVSYDLVAQSVQGTTGAVFSTITYTVRNDGNGAIPSFKLRVEYLYKGQWTTINEATITNLGAFSTRSGTMTWGSLDNVGRFDIRLTVDTAGAVPETSESNNQVGGTASFWTSALPGRNVRNP